MHSYIQRSLSLIVVHVSFQISLWNDLQLNSPCSSSRLMVVANVVILGRVVYDESISLLFMAAVGDDGALLLSPFPPLSVECCCCIERASAA